MEATIRYAEYTILCKEAYCGIRYWRHVNYLPNRYPSFAVYTYLGVDKEKDLYFFRHRDTNSIIWKKYEELKSTTFGPFLFDFRKISEALEKIKEERETHKPND